MVNVFLGLPTSWSAFAWGINSCKDTPTFEQMWNACSQEEARILLVSNKEDGEKNTSQMPIPLIKRREPSRSTKDQRRRLTCPRLNVIIAITWVIIKAIALKIQGIKGEIGIKQILSMKHYLRIERLKNQKSRTYTTKSSLSYPS